MPRHSPYALLNLILKICFLSQLLSKIVSNFTLKVLLFFKLVLFDYFCILYSFQCALLRKPHQLLSQLCALRTTDWFCLYASSRHITARSMNQSKAHLVGPSGLEPPTSRLSGVRSNLLSYGPVLGGDEENRTPDPLLARQVLSQLSYTPISKYFYLVGKSNFSAKTYFKAFLTSFHLLPTF